MNHPAPPEPATMRALVRAEVAARRPVDARERDSIRQFLTAFDQLSEPFSEHGQRVHVTASAIVVADAPAAGERRDSRYGVLLHEHKRLHMWLQPGGHIDAGELPWHAAWRETVEETGLPVAPFGEQPALLHVDVHNGGRHHVHLDLRYLVTSPAVDPSPPPGESQAVCWFSWRAAIAVADVGLEGVLRALQPGVPVLRAARHDDAGGCAAVHQRSRRFALVGFPEIHDDADVRRWMADDVIGHRDVTVADVDGVIVGYMALDHAAVGGWIEHLYVDPAWLGRGLGDRFVSVAKQRHPAGLQLWTFAANDPAQRFYERHGFVAEERTDGAGNEERMPDIRYGWSPG